MYKKIAFLSKLSPSKLLKNLTVIFEKISSSVLAPKAFLISYILLEHASVT